MQCFRSHYVAKIQLNAKTDCINFGTADSAASSLQKANMRHRVSTYSGSIKPREPQNGPVQREWEYEADCAQCCVLKQGSSNNIQNLQHSKSTARLHDWMCVQLQPLITCTSKRLADTVYKTEMSLILPSTERKHAAIGLQAHLSRVSIFSDLDAASKSTHQIQ